MNAFAPKATLLIKLATLIRKVSLLNSPVSPYAELKDPEVLDWLARMAELEYIPKCDAVVTIIPEGQTAALSLLDSEQDRIECGAVISEMHGYQLSAEGGFGIQATYCEAPTPEAALQRCLEEFSPDDGFKNHSAADIETWIETWLEPPALSLD